MNETGVSAIVSSNFIEKLLKDMKKYDILYLCAPFGWEKEAILKTACEKLNAKDICWLEYGKGDELAQQILKASKSKKMVYMITNLEVIVEKGEQDLIWELMANKKSGDVFVIASSALLPAKMLPYTIMNRFISYGIEDIRPSNAAVASYMKDRGVSLSEEELDEVERDCNNYPLYIYLLSNLMSGSNRGYRRVVKEGCFEDLFTYIDVVFFRGFEEVDQNTMLKLSCLEQFDTQLITYMLDISRKEANAFVERLLIKGSVLEKTGNGWRFYPVMKQFLERAIQKYLDYEERLEEYKKAMEYLIGKNKWFPALRFAYILQDKEQMAVCLNHLVSEYIDYNDFVSLEMYFRDLPTDVLMRYPTLMIAGSILKAAIGDQKASRRYEKLYFQLIDQVEDEITRKKLYIQLLFMYMSRPGMLREDVLEISTELLEAIGNDRSFEGNSIFEPHYISVLRGEKDYCKYFHQSHGGKVLKKLHEVADKLSDHTFSIMLDFMEAEVFYERNELDCALDGLVKTS